MKKVLCMLIVTIAIGIMGGGNRTYDYFLLGTL